MDDEDIKKIAETYHAWAETGETDKAYECIPGFCKAVDKVDIAAQCAQVGKMTWES